MAKTQVDWRNFAKAIALASEGGVRTVMITGKGEPALFPEQIGEYLSALEPFGFPFVELQTNGILFQEKPERYHRHLTNWYERGLTTIAISIVHYRAEANRAVYLPHRQSYIDLEKLIDDLHRMHFTVRLACVLCRGMIDSAESLNELIQFAKRNGVEQLAVRPVNSPSDEGDPAAHQWVRDHSIMPEQLEEMREFVQRQGTWLYEFPHGGAIYDVSGQNLCITNSLTKARAGGEVRQLIFFPDGTLSFDWEHQGAVLLRGRFKQQEENVTLRRVI